MLQRFTGPDGRRLLVAALRSQTVVQGEEHIASQLADIAELMTCSVGTALITQNAADNDLYLILSGSVTINVNGRDVARRFAGEHVGEMALIDPKAKRSASVIAAEESVIARIPEPSFTAIASRHPDLWRRLACELGDRLRQRNDLVRQRNSLSRVFIASSRESLTVANEIQVGLARDPFVVSVWTNRVFGPSDFSLEALERATAEADFAVLVLGPDDHVTSRDMEMDAPRDNVIFELGMFIGALGRRRVFLVLPQAANIKIPTDLLGITPAVYADGDAKDLPARIGPVCTELRTAINAQGPR